MVNTKLLLMFLARQKVAVPPERVDEELERLKQKLKSEGQDLATALLQSNTSMDDVRKQIEERTRWQEFLRIEGDRRRAAEVCCRSTATCSAAPRSGRATSCSSSSPTRARPTRKRPSKSSRASRKRSKGARSRFAAAANKYSEDPANAGGAGGDLDYFSLNTGLIEEFTDVAFKLKKGMISDPVETPFGFHLIQVTDRKEGKEPDFEQNKPYIYQPYATDLQKEIVTAEKKTAKIDIKPMPKDLSHPKHRRPTAAPRRRRHETGQGGSRRARLWPKQ